MIHLLVTVAALVRTCPPWRGLGLYCAAMKAAIAAFAVAVARESTATFDVGVPL